MKFVDIIGNDLTARFISFLNILTDFLINLAGNLFRIITLLVEVPPEKDLMSFPFAEGNRPQDVAHAILRDHVANDPGGPLNVALRSGTDLF